MTADVVKGKLGHGGCVVLTGLGPGTPSLPRGPVREKIRPTKDVMSSPSDQTCRDLLSSSAARVRAGLEPWSLRRPLVSIVMGLDQHRGQITGEWIDTESGEVQRSRVAPADRVHVRKWR